MKLTCATIDLYVAPGEYIDLPEEALGSSIKNKHFDQASKTVEGFGGGKQGQVMFLDDKGNAAYHASANAAGKTDKISYQIHDKNGNLATGTIKIHITRPKNQPNAAAIGGAKPVLNVYVEAGKSIPLPTDGLGKLVTNPDFDHTYQNFNKFSDATLGAVSFSNGAATYAANKNAAGKTEALTFRVNDMRLHNETGLVKIHIIPAKAKSKTPLALIQLPSLTIPSRL